MRDRMSSSVPSRSHRITWLLEMDVPFQMFERPGEFKLGTLPFVTPIQGRIRLRYSEMIKRVRT